MPNFEFNPRLPFKEQTPDSRTRAKPAVHQVYRPSA
jgi:hypothetical protein